MPCFIDPIDQSTYPLSEKIWRAPNGNPLMITPLKGINRQDIISNERSIWRYKASFPVPINNPISLGEGCTPLVKHHFNNHSCFFKLEWFSPTGSFKDRGASVLLSFLKQQSISTIVEDSSGNGGAAIAAYCAAAGITAKILVPATTQPAKITQIRAYGADVVLVPGPREASETAAIALSETHFYASHNWHPFFLQGTKTLAYEIWEDLNFNVPDNIIIPAAAGSSLLGCYIAFKELLTAGVSNKMPRLFVSQPANCSPVHNSFQAGTEDYIDTDFSPTIAEGTAIKQPIRLKQILSALKETNGGTVISTEEEIIKAGLKLAQIGLYTEPSSAHAASALSKLVKNGSVNNNDVNIVILTGSGLKATAFYTKQFEN